MNHIIAIGSVSLDTIEAPGGSGRDLLGGSAVYFSLAASMHSPVHLLAPIGDAHLEVNDLRNMGLGDRPYPLSLDSIEQYQGATFRWTGKYDEHHNAKTLSTDLGVFEGWAPSVKSITKCLSSELGKPIFSWVTSTLRSN